MHKGFVKSIIKTAFFFSFLNFSSAQLFAESSIHWSYAGAAGPKHWADLSPKYATCGSGTRQSPVNIDTAKTRIIKQDEIDIDYEKGAFEVVNNGHTIQVNLAPGSKINIAGIEYFLRQFHFHSASEHTFNDRHYPMEVHLVHMNSQGQLGVLGVMVQYGEANKALEAVLAADPRHKGKHVLYQGNTINPAMLLPTGDDTVEYFNYTGSLTTPPCTEGVNWLVAKKTISASTEQLAAFNAILTRYGQYPGNNRPIQNLNYRVVNASED